MKRRDKLAGLVATSILLCALGASGVMIDDDFPGGDAPDLCLVPEVLGTLGAPYLNGLPVIQQQSEIVGDNVKVVGDDAAFAMRCRPARCRSNGRSRVRAAP